MSSYEEQLAKLKQFGLAPTPAGDGIDLPDPGLEGRTFEPGGFVGPLIAGRYFSFYSALDLNDAQYQSDFPKNTWFRRQKGHAYDYYFPVQALALEALKISNSTTKPDRSLNAPIANYCFVFQRDRIINWSNSEAQAAWPELMVFDVNQCGWKAKDYAQYNLIVVPSIVAAMANFAGSPVQWDHNELLKKPVDVAGDSDKDEAGNWKPYVQNPYDDAHIKSLVGFKDAYLDSLFYQRRKQLWETLGWDNGNTYDYRSIDPETAGVLRGGLEVASTKGLPEMWGKVVLVYDPKGYYRRNDGNAGWRQIPILARLYTGETEARREVEEIKASRAGSDSPVSDFTPEMVKENGAKPDEKLVNMKIVKDEYSKGLNGPAAIIKRNALAKIGPDDAEAIKSMGFTVDELEQAWDSLQTSSQDNPLLHRAKSYSGLYTVLSSLE